MRVQAFIFALAVISSVTLGGCGSNQSLGSGLPDDAGVGGSSATSSVTSVTGGSTALGGAGGTSATASASAGSSAATGAAGQTSTVKASSLLGGSSASAGASASGGASTIASSGKAGASVAGSSVVAGSATGGTSSGGTTAAGGTLSSSSSTAGSAGAGGASGVTLIASQNQNVVSVTWQNNTSGSIFLYGCGTVDAYRKDAAGWTKLGKYVACTWEGASPEVKAGTSYTDPGPGTYGLLSKEWLGSGGLFRFSGTYGVGCTNPSAGQSRAGCTAFHEITSNELVVIGPPTVPDAGADAVCGTMPEGVTCRKPTGGCAAMTCNNGSWACASGQTPVALVPGACDGAIDAAAVD